MDYIANNNGETNLCVLSALIQGEGQYLRNLNYLRKLIHGPPSKGYARAC